MSYELARASHLRESCTGVPVGAWTLFGRAFDVPGSFGSFREGLPKVKYALASNVF